MSLGQSLQQKLLQKLSPQQIQLMKLLQVPTANLEERIKEELEENPALEQSDEGHEDEYTDELKDEFDGMGEEDSDPDGSEDDYDNVDISEYVVDDDGEIADYKMKDDNYPEMDDQKVIPIKLETSFHELVLNQLGMLELDERNYKIAEQIVGSLDDDGYLRRELSSISDDLAFRQSLIVEEKEIEAIILQIQQFDPAGIAARDLKECLLLQLKRKTDEGKSVELAAQILTKYFEEFTKKHYEKIQKSLGLTDEQLKDVFRRSPEFKERDLGAIIRRVYQDELGREPDPSGIAAYTRGLGRGMTESEFRAELRRSREGAEHRSRGIVTKAYREVLRREPDPAGLETYLRLMVDKGWDDSKVRAALRSGDEFRNLPR